MKGFIRLFAVLVGLSVFAFEMQPAKAANIKPLQIQTGYDDVVKVGRRRSRANRHRGGRRNYRSGRRHYRSGRRYRSHRRYRRHRNRNLAIGLGIGVGAAIIGNSIYNDRYYSGRRYHRSRRYNRRYNRRRSYGGGVYYGAPVYYQSRRVRRRSNSRSGDAHVGWCTRRYRSYRVSDNTFQPYHGGRRRCNSPYD